MSDKAALPQKKRKTDDAKEVGEKLGWLVNLTERIVIVERDEGYSELPRYKNGGWKLVPSSKAGSQVSFLHNLDGPNGVSVPIYKAHYADMDIKWPELPEGTTAVIVSPQFADAVCAALNNTNTPPAFAVYTVLGENQTTLPGHGLDGFYTDWGFGTIRTRGFVQLYPEAE